MKQNNNKKGFTIVELVIVIAVIAILAAVLIPTFVSITRKANQSADIQAVRQMNTLLAIGDAEGGYDSISEVIFALDQEKIDLENYKALAKGNYFYWVKSENRIIYVDSTNKVLFPEELKDVTNEGWYSLSGLVPTNDKWTDDIEDTTLSVNDAAKFVDFVNKFNDKDAKATAVKTITLTSDIDLKGASANFGDIASDLTINGGGYSIKNLRADSNTYVGKGDNTGDDSNYWYGLIGKISAGKVSVSNLKIDGISIGSTSTYDTSGLGIIAGNIASSGELTVTNVTISNSTVFGANKIGAIVGYINGANSKLTLNNVDVTSTTLEGVWNIAKVVGFAQHGTVTIDDDCDFSGITTKYSAAIAEGLAAEKPGDADPADTKDFGGVTFINRPLKLDDAKEINSNATKYYYPTVTDKNLWIVGDVADDETEVTYNCVAADNK